MDGDGSGVTPPEGVGAGDEPSTGSDGPGAGFLVLLLPGFGLAVLADGRGSVEAAGAETRAEGPCVEPAPPFDGLLPASPVAPALGGKAAGADGCARWLGGGEVSTRAAGVSSFWRGTGSQGALELPDRSVATMTTA
ncbi:hypothetical protein SAV31267_040400 [Streptomyces avermitilis]|uniref:Uncharacterized protein n=1 Tax=Streptomyces avermitilis TaxID=33903 RepID=A0A4D4MSX4_STRAX|nr:hypothetical protein SAVMC3_58490 [Streptomyces avermitilis]GDY74555.1 hypothetical protein SAV31267_040400 [Streptomyces avermitilis]